jgi:hypothetical protein
MAFADSMAARKIMLPTVGRWTRALNSFRIMMMMRDSNSDATPDSHRGVWSILCSLIPLRNKPRWVSSEMSPAIGSSSWEIRLMMPRRPLKRTCTLLDYCAGVGMKTTCAPQVASRFIAIRPSCSHATESRRSNAVASPKKVSLYTVIRRKPTEAGEQTYREYATRREYSAADRLRRQN